MPHKPLAASESFYTPDTPDDLYADVIRELDSSVGAVRSALEKLEILDQTIFIFMSDNGPYWGGSTGGLKGRKAKEWEGGVRVPFVIRYPRAFPAAQVVSTPLWSLDLFPTLIELTGVSRPAGIVIDGENIVPVLKGEKKSHGPIFTAHNEKVMSIREGDWKLFLNKPKYLSREAVADRPLIKPLSRDEGLLAPSEQPGPGQYPGVIPEAFPNPLPLFNLAEDRAEMRDLAAEHPEIADRLRTLAQKYLEAMSHNP